MNSLIIFAVFVMAAYIFQMFLGWQQLKDFNKTCDAPKTGSCSGRKSGRIKSGTIVMFAVDENGRVLKASKMQGVTILARFQNMDDYVGRHPHILTSIILL
ncbi:MAG: transcriptional regulator GutM [Streptococcus sp.]